MNTLIPLSWFLIVAGCLFAIGMLVLLTKRNAIAALIGIELMLNAANLNLIAFSQYDPAEITGQMFSLFVIVIAASETAVALAIIILVHKHYQTIHLHKTNKLKD